MRRSLLIAMIAAGCVIPSVALSGQSARADNGAATENSSYERLLFPIRHLDPAAVADKVATVFNHGGGSAVTVLPVAGARCVLISAPQETLKEIVKMLDQLDQPPRAISIDVWFVDLHPDASKSDVATPRPPAELLSSGERGKVIEAVNKLEKDGKAAVVNHFQFTTLEGREAVAQQGERKPRVTATNMTNAGRISTVALDNIGTIVKATPRIAGPNQIMLDIDAEKSFIAPEFTGTVISQPVNGPEVRSPSYVTLLGKTTASIKSGEVTSLTGLKSTPDDTAGSYQVLVSAEVLPPDAGGN
jgi:type II secretory pathway component GspD/PulD (secretin)